MKIFRYIPLSLAMGLVSFTALAQEEGMQALSNIELSYTYSDGGAVILTINDGRLGYRWTAGVFEGVEVNGLAYYSKEIANSIYLVSWHDSENKNFATLIFDLNRMVEHGTALVAYETPDEATLFDEARIDSVRRLE